MAVAPQPVFDDENSFALLDAYLEDLHAGRRPDRDRLLAEHPELASALRCLEALDQLAPQPQRPRVVDDTERSTLPLPPAAAAQTPPPFANDTQFSKYEMLCEIGRGGMGVVCKARQKDLDRIVAVKMILSSHLASADHVERFVAE